MPIIKVDQVQTTASKKILGTTGSVINVVQNQITTPWYGHSPGSSYILVPPLTCSIKPTNTSNKILVNFRFFGGSTGSWDRLEYLLYINGSASSLLGDASSSAGRATGKWFYPGNANDGPCQIMGLVYLHSPASTSVQTYDIYIRDGNGDGASFSLNRGRAGTGTEQESNCASSVTLMEISA